MNMESSKAVSKIRLNSVVPGKLTGNNAVREVTGMDLALKLHYITTVHFFSNEACEGMTYRTIKDSLFYFCVEFFNICGRFRRGEDGRPYMKCNDSGVRVVEAESSKTLNEWLVPSDFSSFASLVYHLPLGPQLIFSPPCFIQITKMKCGGMAVGVSFAHVLGDAFYLARCLGRWSPYLAGLREFVSQEDDVTKRGIAAGGTFKEAQSIKEVKLAERDEWKVENSQRMKEIFVILSSSQARDFVSAVYGDREPSFFHAVSAVTWQCIARVREHEPNIVTVCKEPDTGVPIVGNCMRICTVTTGLDVKETELNLLAELLGEESATENDDITNTVEDTGGVNDYVLYGANLTFVNLEDAEFDQLTANGYAAKNVYCRIRHVGDEGALWVQQWRTEGEEKGKLVTIVVPEDKESRLISALSEHNLHPMPHVNC